MCTTHCLSTETMVERKRLNVTLYVQCLSCSHGCDVSHIMSLFLKHGGFAVFKIQFSAPFNMEFLYAYKHTRIFKSEVQ
jgi:hypothetical protein